MEGPDQSSLPDLATWPVFGVIVFLLTGALVFDVVLSPHWTDPFHESGTWVLIGVVTGGVLRGLGQWLAQRESWVGRILRWLSLAVWTAAALGGLVSLML